MYDSCARRRSEGEFELATGFGIALQGLSHGSGNLIDAYDRHGVMFWKVGQAAEDHIIARKEHEVRRCTASDVVVDAVEEVDGAWSQAGDRYPQFCDRPVDNCKGDDIRQRQAGSAPVTPVQRGQDGFPVAVTVGGDAAQSQGLLGPEHYIDAEERKWG